MNFVFLHLSNSLPIMSTSEILTKEYTKPEICLLFEALTITQDDTEEDVKVILFEKDNIEYDRMSSNDVIKPTKIEEPEFVKKKFTKFCDSVLTKSECKHGTKCCFAHNAEQINPVDCPFGSICKNVLRKTHECYINTGNRLCDRLHTNEGREDYILRINQYINSIPTLLAPSQPTPILSKKCKRLCESVVNHTVCRHGARCTFAHCGSQLVEPLPCRFGSQCVNIRLVKGVYQNTDRL